MIFALLHTAGFLSSIEAVMNSRTPQGAGAWVISLNTIPAVALPAYWVMGRSTFNGYGKERQKDESELSQANSCYFAAEAVFYTSLVSTFCFCCI